MMSQRTHISHVLAAADESDAGRQAVIAALRIASRTGAWVTIARVLPFDGPASRGGVDQLQRWVESDLPPIEPPVAVEYAIAYGVPGVEIARVAERVRADLLVLGRKPRSQAVRLLLGDTADAVARRSRTPCLFVPVSGTGLGRMVVAVDGSARGHTVLNFAVDFAAQVSADLRVLTVERVHAGEPTELALATPAARSTSLQADLDRHLALSLEVRRGNAAEQIVEALAEGGEDIVVIGCHRGGPAGVIEAGSTARRVIHQAPCAVLTVAL
jgi:nucleotide-binding universal stress UspA family protein